MVNDTSTPAERIIKRRKGLRALRLKALALKKRAEGAE